MSCENYDKNLDLHLPIVLIGENNITCTRELQRSSLLSMRESLTFDLTTRDYPRGLSLWDSFSFRSQVLEGQHWCGQRMPLSPAFASVYEMSLVCLPRHTSFVGLCARSQDWKEL